MIWAFSQRSPAPLRNARAFLLLVMRGLLQASGIHPEKPRAHPLPIVGRDEEALQVFKHKHENIVLRQRTAGNIPCNLDRNTGLSSGASII